MSADSRSMNQIRNVVSVSGGKDSTALLLLAIESQADNLQAVFADTGHEHAQTYEYIRYLEEATGVQIRWVRADFSGEINARRAKLEAIARGESVSRMATWTPERAEKAALAMIPTGVPFLDLCILKGRFPSTKARFCSEELKRNPLIEQVMLPLLEEGNTVYSWQGVRADESPSRAALPEMEDVGGGLFNYRPILRWTASEVFDMHRKHGIEPNPLYRQGMGRVGCMPCIHARKDELLEISKRFPAEIERVAEWERIVGGACRRGYTTFFNREVLGPGRLPVEYYEAENVHMAVKWAKTGKGGKQYDILRSDASESPACSSIYGLCA